MKKHTLGIDIGSTTVKIAILDENDTLVFSDYERQVTALYLWYTDFEYV